MWTSLNFSEGPHSRCWNSPQHTKSVPTVPSEIKPKPPKPSPIMTRWSQLRTAMATGRERPRALSWHIWHGTRPADCLCLSADTNDPPGQVVQSKGAGFFSNNFNCRLGDILDLHLSKTQPKWKSTFIEKVRKKSSLPSKSTSSTITSTNHSHLWCHLLQHFRPAAGLWLRRRRHGWRHGTHRCLRAPRSRRLLSVAGIWRFGSCVDFGSCGYSM